MGYNTRITGNIEIVPPLKPAEIKRLPEFNDVRIATATETIETEDGDELVRYTRTAIVPDSDDRYRAYSVVEEVQAIIDAHPDRGFYGYLEGRGEDDYDLWRLSVRDGKAVKTMARIVWDDEQ